MSRALDGSIVEALTDRNHGTVFEEIAAVLTRLPHTILEIELLGLSHLLSPAICFQQDGNAIGIPKLRLVQAFLHARKIFKDHLQRNTQLPDESIRKTTAVMLLFDSEHVTAANARKKTLVNAQLSQTDTAALLRSKKLFVHSLLTSRLHRHTKSPNLWSHRRWLMRHFKDKGLALDIAEDLKTVLFVSAERHPRNYYAWAHARCIIESAGGASNVRAEISAMIADTMHWCFSHHEDVSGWMFLMFLLDRWPAGVAAVLAETMELTKLFRWRNESVWYFLRNIILVPGVTEAQKDCFDSTLKEASKDMPRAGQGRKVLDGALQWTRKYTEKPAVKAISL